MEGYPKAAANFSKEANLKPQQDESFVVTRQKILASIHMGDIEEAITALNHFNPEVCNAPVFLCHIPSPLHLFTFRYDYKPSCTTHRPMRL